MKDDNKCEVPHCQKESFMTYYNKGVCPTHYKSHCDGKINLKEIFKIKE